MVSIEVINGGDEITMDYSTIIGADDTWKMKCNCGQKSCRGVIGQFRAIPNLLRQKYILLKVKKEKFQKVIVSEVRGKGTYKHKSQ